MRKDCTKKFLEESFIFAEKAPKTRLFTPTNAKKGTRCQMHPAPFFFFQS